MGAWVETKKTIEPLIGGVFVLRAVLESFSRGRVVLHFLERDVRVSVPRSLLPSDLIEGDVLKISIEHDVRATEELRRRDERLVRRLSSRR